MVCIGGTCSASSFSSCLLFHLTAKIKAYNQILWIGPDRGGRPRVSPLLSLSLSLSLSPPLSVLPSLARSHGAVNDNESWEAGVPVSQDSGLHQSAPPADSHLVVICAVCSRSDLAISSLLPRPLLRPLPRPLIDHPEWLTGSSLTPPSSCSPFGFFFFFIYPAPLFFLLLFPLFVFVSNLSCSSCV